MFLLHISLIAQNIISGTITDSTSKPITGASIFYTAVSDKQILGFTVSDIQGNFKLDIKTPLNSVELHITHINFEKKDVKLANKSGHYSFTLSSKSINLPDFITSAYESPVYRKKDTINYKVDSFASKQDRVILDVIKKIPGIQINGDQILYQGKPIQQYTINGLNLMGAKYGVINNTLPVDAVKKIQIKENDQPIKILDSLFPSDKASLNLILKGGVKTTGTGKVSVGTTPFLWDDGLTPMTFTKKFQMLNDFQANNTGNDISNQFKDLISENDFQSIHQPFLSVPNVGNPPFDKIRWLDNNIKLVSSNFVFKSNNELTWRGGITYTNDFQKNQGLSKTIIYTPGENINTIDSIHNTYNLNDLSLNLAMRENKSNIYINDEFKTEIKWNKNTGEDFHDYSDILQNNHSQTNFVTNRLKITTIIGKQLIDINSTLSYNEMPEQLAVSRDQFSSILNDSIPYQQMMQTVHYKKFYTDDNVSLIKYIKPIVVQIQGGFSFSSEALKSNLQTDSQQYLGAQFTNDLDFYNPKIYVNPIFGFQRKKLSINLSAPIVWQSFFTKYNQQKATDSSRLGKCIFNPSINAYYKLSSSLQLGYSSTYGNNFGDLSQLIQSYILYSFNNLNRSNVNKVSQGYSWEHTMYLRYEDALKARFANINVDYQKGYNNSINNIVYDTAGLAYNEMLPLGNYQYSISANGNFSQYLNTLKTSLKLSATWNKNVSDQLLNDSLTKLDMQTHGFGISINNSAWKYATFDYEGNFNWSKTANTEENLNKVFFEAHHLEINIFPKENHTFSIYTDYYRNSSVEQTSQVFLNLKYIFTLPKNKTDFTITCNNIFNSKRFITQYNSSYSFIYSELYLRPRQILLSVRFNFK